MNFSFKSRAFTECKRHFFSTRSFCNCFKLVFVTDDEAKYARAFVPGKLFQPCLIFAGEDIDHKGRAPESCYTKVDLLASISNRLGWNGLSRTNALTYFGLLVGDEDLNKVL